MRNRQVVAQAQQEVELSCPKEGWVEQDPDLLVSSVKDVRT